MLTRGGELAATTQLSDFDRHTIYYSRKTLMIRFGTAQPLRFFFKSMEGVRDGPKNMKTQTQYVPSLAEGRRGQKNSVFFKDITKSQVNPSSQFLSKVTRITKLLQFVSQIGILQKVLREQRMKLILPI